MPNGDDLMTFLHFIEVSFKNPEKQYHVTTFVQTGNTYAVLLTGRTQNLDAHPGLAAIIMITDHNDLNLVDHTVIKVLTDFLMCTATLKKPSDTTISFIPIA